MFIIASGMVCPVGLDAEAACASFRAKMSSFKELPYFDNQGEPIVGAQIPGMNTFPRKTADLVELLAKSLSAVVNSRVASRWSEVPLLVGIPDSDRPDGRQGLVRTIIPQVEEALKVRFHPTRSKAYASGHTATFEALADARELLSKPGIAACLVAGVDSFINARTLLALDRDFRLKTPANRDGLIPGEASGAILLGKEPAPECPTEIAGLGFGNEKAHLLSGEPLLGLGLTAAVKTALREANLGFHEIDCRLSDVTGELYGFKELPLVEGRLMRVVRKKEQPLWHWAESIGDTGAAAGVLQLIAADTAFRKDYAPGNQFLCMASGPWGNRAAVVLRRHSC